MAEQNVVPSALGGASRRRRSILPVVALGYLASCIAMLVGSLLAGGLVLPETVGMLVAASVEFAVQALMIYGVFLIVRPLFRRLFGRRNDDSRA